MPTRLTRADLPQADPYQIQTLIKSGDIGAVYRAYDPRSSRIVALKGLWGDDSSLSDEERHRFFAHEAEMLTLFDFSRIPTLYEYVAGRRPYLALQWINGQDLQVRFEASGGALPVADVLRWAVQVCDALHYLHTLAPRPVAFRDLKPSHIIVDAHDQAWLVDFNLAIVLPPDGITRSASLEGTEGFAAPEQYQGTVSALSDVFGLGATLHYLLSGRNPMQEKPWTFHEFDLAGSNPGVSPALEDVILRALAADPADRFLGADALGEALAEHIA